LIGPIIVCCVIAFIGFGLYTVRKSKPKKVKSFNAEWREILEEYVKDYRDADAALRKDFEEDVLHFLGDVKIKGIQCEIDDVDRMLVAAGAVIPFLGFREFGYPNLDEVLIYPGRFNFDHEFGKQAPDKRISGMVGTGYMNRTMILSKPDLRAGFSINNDKHNVSIHEFVHLMDMADGSTDGIPSAFVNCDFILPWLDVMSAEIAKIQKGKSSIRPYGAFNKQEFLAVTSEYFFEQPRLLKRKHPELYRLLSKVYNRGEK